MFFTIVELSTPPRMATTATADDAADRSMKEDDEPTKMATKTLTTTATTTTAATTEIATTSTTMTTTMTMTTS